MEETPDSASAFTIASKFSCRTFIVVISKFTMINFRLQDGYKRRKSIFAKCGVAWRREIEHFGKNNIFCMIDEYHRYNPKGSLESRVSTNITDTILKVLSSRESRRIFLQFPQESPLVEKKKKLGYNVHQV